MVRIYANRIWAGTYDYNSDAAAYVKLKDAITGQMRQDVEGRKKVSGVECTAELFEEITRTEY